MSSSKSIIKILISVLLISIGARITIDIGNIPITGQTLFITVCAVFMKPLESFIALSLYLILGGFGVPIFADGESGLDKFTNGSGGFLIGFLVASVLISFFIEKYGKSMNLILQSMVMGTAVILFFGASWLSYLFSFQKGLEYGFYPFWTGAVVKILLGTFICTIIVRLQSYLNQKGIQ